MDPMLESFLVSIAANFTTEGVKKLWGGIRRRLTDRQVDRTQIERFEANDPASLPPIRQALETLLQDDPEYAEELKKLASKLEKLLPPAGGGVVQKQKKIKNSIALQITGNGHTVTVPNTKKE